MQATHNERIERLDWLHAAALSLCVFLVYLRTLCPTVYLGDSGEIAAAITTGGIVHPPGYPLFTLLGRAALLLVPVGEPAFRIGCLVVLAAALAVGTLFLIAREVGAGRPAATAAAALFGFCFTLWNQSTRVEVYSFHVLLVALVLLFALRYRRAGRFSDALLGALALSAGLAHHTTIVLLGPALLVWCGPRVWGVSGRGRRLAGLAAVLLVGPSLFLLLILWARAEPLQAWGRPVNLHLLWVHASARIYHNHLQFPDGVWLPKRLAEAGRITVDNLPWGAFLLPAAGLIGFWKRDRGLAAGFFLAVLVPVAFNQFYRIDDIAAYYLEPLLAAFALLAAAVSRIDRLPQGRIRWAPASALVLVLAGLQLVRNLSACDLSRATWVREFTRQKLESTAPNAVLITEGDDDTFPTWYVHDVLKVRPDVLLFDRIFSAGAWRDYDLDPSLWYYHRLRREGLNVRVTPPEDPATLQSLLHEGQLVDSLTHELRNRPIYLTGASRVPRAVGMDFTRWASARYDVLPVGLVLELHPKSKRVNVSQLLRRNEALWREHIRLPDLHGVRTDEDLDSDYLGSQYASMLVNFGNLKEMTGDLRGAEALYRRAAEWNPHFRSAAEALAAVRRRERS